MAANEGMTGTMGTYDKMPPPPRDGFFVQPTKAWNATNLEFMHQIAAEEHIREIPKLAPKNDGNHYEVPADKIADWTDVMYGALPEALTARPRQMEGGCCPPRQYTIARHMFGDGVALAKVETPAFACLWDGGCAGADVTVEPIGSVGGKSYKGILKKQICGECIGNETTLEWETENKPYMTFRAMSTLDSCKLQFCQDVWVGWRGSTTAVPQRIATYDASLILNICWGLKYACRPWKNCCVSCCSVDDSAPRFARAEDLRRVVAAKYDYEFACRDVAQGDDAEIATGENADEATLTRILPRAHAVDALYSTRLYHDVVCGKFNIAWANDKDALHVREASVDVRYRGSINHANVSEDDHLVVLAGLIMQAFFQFPSKNTGLKVWSAGEHHRGYIRPRQGGAIGMDGAMASNAV